MLDLKDVRLSAGRDKWAPVSGSTGITSMVAADAGP
jgi:hypothetical protein